jgi:hypothetical protein
VKKISNLALKRKHDILGRQQQQQHDATRARHGLTIGACTDSTVRDVQTVGVTR